MNELKQTKKYLNRLYSFDDDDDDDVLKEKILQTRTRIAEIEELIKDAEKQSEIELKIQRAKEIFRTLKSTWPCMSQEERQAICRELIERIDICKNGEIKMRLKLNNYLVKIE
jgi:hypothetical protein